MFVCFVYIYVCVRVCVCVLHNVRSHLAIPHATLTKDFSSTPCDYSDNALTFPLLHTNLDQQSRVFRPYSFTPPSLIIRFEFHTNPALADVQLFGMVKKFVRG
jgi:hypothetical protein